MKKEDKPKKITVVQQLPTQQLREVESEEEVFECLTIEETLGELLEKVRELSKKI